jgi:hypothetical protein
MQPATQSKPQPTQQAPVAAEKNEQAIVQTHVKKSVGSAVKSTVTFNNNQIVWLDRLSSDIRATTMAIVDRGAIIRAIISAVEQSSIDLCNATSEDQIRDLVCAKLKMK